MRAFTILLACISLGASALVGKSELVNPKSNPNAALDNWTKQSASKLTPEQRRFISNACAYAIKKRKMQPEAYLNSYFKIKQFGDHYFIFFGHIVNYQGTGQIWKYQKIELSQGGDGVGWEIYD